MKPATEWVELQPCSSANELRWIEAIQLDAIKDQNFVLLKYNKTVCEILSNGGKITQVIWEALIDCQQNWGRLQCNLRPTEVRQLTKKDL